MASDMYEQVASDWLSTATAAGDDDWWRDMCGEIASELLTLARLSRG